MLKYQAKAHDGISWPRRGSLEAATGPGETGCECGGTGVRAAALAATGGQCDTGR